LRHREPEFVRRDTARRAAPHRRDRTLRIALRRAR